MVPYVFILLYLKNKENKISMHKILHLKSFLFNHLVEMNILAGIQS